MENINSKQHSAAASNKLGAQVKITGYDWLYDGTTKGARQAALEREEESMLRKWASATRPPRLLQGFVVRFNTIPLWLNIKF